MTTPRELVDLLRTVDKLHIAASNPVPTYVFVAIEEAASTIERLVEALEKTEALIQQGQAIIGSHLPPDGMSAAEAMSKLVGLLDGPDQREAQELARRAFTGGE